jgi:hypothetical protein
MSDDKKKREATSKKGWDLGEGGWDLRSTYITQALDKWASQCKHFQDKEEVEAQSYDTKRADEEKRGRKASVYVVYACQSTQSWTVTVMLQRLCAGTKTARTNIKYVKQIRKRLQILLL